MTGAKFDIEKFDGAGDFGIKMRALVIQLGCEAAPEVLPADMEAQVKAEVKFEDEDLALLLLTSLPASYEHFVDTLLYRREALTLKDVMATLNSKEIKERSKANGDDGEGLYVRGLTDRRDSRQLKRKSRSKSRGGRLRCYIYQSQDHLERNCPKNNRKKSKSYVNKDDQPSSSGLIYDGSEKLDIDWTLEKERYTVKLQSVKIKVINGSGIVLSGTRRDNYVYSLDGHAVAGELNASVEEKVSLALVWHKDWDISVRRDYRCWKSKQNGLAERMNITIKDKVHCLLIQSGLPKTFWAEATCTDKSVEELQVEVELQGLSNRTLENDHTDQEDSNDENA
nr:retrovirus-related Pol polyprotein from transposon TNT 1-94 [Tanacetum cinerariifolium]